MAWTSTQKGLAVRAATAAGWNEDQRRVVLSGVPDQRGVHNGRVTSTAPRLTNEDFEVFMAQAEAAAGGQLMHFSRGYWSTQSADSNHRIRRLAMQIAGELERARQLHPVGEGLSGWIRSRVTAGRTGDVKDLSFRELGALINGLRAFAHQRGVQLTV